MVKAWSGLKESNIRLKSKPVLCIETGKVFDSNVEFAKWLGVFPSNSHKVLTGHRPSIRGYRIVYYRKSS